MKHVFMVNRFSLKSKLESYVEKLKKSAEKLKLDYVVEINNEKLSTEDILKKYKDKNYTIYAVGGDGILNRVVNSLYGTKNLVGCIPLGTGNDFHRTMAEFFTPGKNDVDLIKCNNRYFINVACFGVDADIANDDKIVHNKLIPKSQQYNVAVIKHIILFKPYTFKMQWDNNTQTSKLALVTVCNANYYGGGYHANPDGKYNDGKIDVYVVKAPDRRKVIKYLMAILKSKQTKLDFVEHIRTDKFTIINDKAIDGNLDGERLNSKKFEISVIPKGIKVYYNKELIDLMNA
jgi:YegS/Rv2252/BmrU family lipid kinase